ALLLRVLSASRTGGSGAMAGSDIHFGVLGSLEMRVGASLAPLGTPKQRAVLAMLVVNRNRPVGIDALADAIWEQEPPKRARSTLVTYIWNLRQIISSADADARAVLASAPPGYRLNIPDTHCDLGRFHTEKTAGIRAAAARQFELASGHLS